MDLSLFYFADDAGERTSDRYELLREGARFGDAHGFTAIWTPERHFNRFGGNYPNPAVTGAALAAMTDRIAIRAGSVVAPLHHVLRIAEEWSVVDNLAGGRVGISLASGWNSDDFVLRPDQYHDRRERTVQSVETLRRLWRGETFTVDEGELRFGSTGTMRVFPSPVSAELPMWISTGGNPATVRAAGRAGVGILTHMAGQDIEGLAKLIEEYRSEFKNQPGRVGSGHVVLMLHTYLDERADDVERVVREPLERYLVSAMTLYRSAGDMSRMTPGRRRLAVQAACERYIHRGAALFGSLKEAKRLIERFSAVGVDEIACLIDFGIPIDLVLQSLGRLTELRLPMREATV